MQSNQQPRKMPLPWGSGAGSAYLRSIPIPSQESVQNGAASFTDGFPPSTFVALVNGGAGPFGADFNGLLYQITGDLQWMQAGAPSPFDATFSAQIGGYPKGALIPSAQLNGLYWLSTADNNGNNPDSGGANWIPVGLGISDYLIDSGTPNALNVSLASAGFTVSDGLRVSVKAKYSNTGGSMIAINGTSYTIVQGGSYLSGGEIIANYVYDFIVVGGVALMVSSSSGAVNIQPGTAGNHAVDLNQLNAVDSALTASISTTNTNLTNAINTINSAINSINNNALFYGNITENLALNGYVAIPLTSVADGFERLIIQWGTYSINQGGSITALNFPIEFPVAAYAVSLTPQGSSGTNGQLVAYASSTSQFSYLWESTTTSTQNATMIAIGRG